MRVTVGFFLRTNDRQERDRSIESNRIGFFFFEDAISLAQRTKTMSIANERDNEFENDLVVMNDDGKDDEDERREGNGNSPEGGEGRRANARETEEAEVFQDAVERENEEDLENDLAIEGNVLQGEVNEVKGDVQAKVEGMDEEEYEEEQPALSRAEALTAVTTMIRAIQNGSEELDAPRLGSLLWMLSNALLEDLTDRDDLRVPGNSLEAFPVALVRNIMRHVETIAATLEFEPADVTTQRSGMMIPAIGSHRVAAAEILAVLLQIGCQDIDERIAKLKLPSGQFVLVALVRMFFKYSWSSAFHATVIRLVLAALVSPHEPLWAPMFEGAEESIQGLLSSSIRQALATKPISTREGNVGSVIILANALCELESCDDVERAGVRTTLQADATWRSTVEGENNSLQKLNDEQAGGLCGPKPTKSPGYMDSGMGSNVISSQELLRMLQQISLGAAGMTQ